MPPSQHLVHCSHFGVHPVVGLRSDWHHGPEATGRFPDNLGQFRHAFVTGYPFGVLDALFLPMTHHRFVDIYPRNHQRPEEVAFARFVDAEPRPHEIRINLRLIPQPRLLENFRLEHELHKFPRPLALHQQFAAGIKIDVEFFAVPRESRVRYVTHFEIMRQQMRFKQARLFLGEFAGVRSERPFGHYLPSTLISTLRNSTG